MHHKKTNFNLVFVVCHPDDEAVWVGGLLYELQRFSFITTHVICLSGQDSQSPRPAEFKQAMDAAGVKSHIVMGGKLRPALDPLPSIENTILSGLSKLNLNLSEVDLLITHSPYGDEQCHPHHMQAFHEAFNMARRLKISFGYFSCIPINVFKLSPLLASFKRKDTLHLLNLSKCSGGFSFLMRLINPRLRNALACPKYYLQFQIDINVKKAMLSSYVSVDPESFNGGYVAFSSNCENIYIYDEKGFAPFRRIIEEMDVPGVQNLFRLLNFWPMLANRIRTIIVKGN